MWVKDETQRMRLGAFKALGGVYAVARLIAQELDQDFDPAELLSDKAKLVAAEMTFVCASAGNHGMAVAAGANLFGAQCRIHLSKTVPPSFADRLTEKNATVVWSGDTYEESIELAIKDAADRDAIHLADGSWEGYIEPPRLVMEGYTVMAEEMREAFEKSGSWPSHVYLQAGVGGLAGSVAYMIRKNWSVQPEIIVVEPDAAPCLKESVAAGEMLTVEGPVSNMGRLDCKTPSLIAFDILKNCADRFVTVSDDEAVKAAATAQGFGIGTSPSGVAGLAALMKEDTTPQKGLVILSEGSI